MEYTSKLCPDALRIEHLSAVLKTRSDKYSDKYRNQGYITVLSIYKGETQTHCGAKWP